MFDLGLEGYHVMCVYIFFFRYDYNLNFMFIVGWNFVLFIIDFLILLLFLKIFGECVVFNI